MKKLICKLFGCSWHKMGGYSTEGGSEITAWCCFRCRAHKTEQWDW